MLRAYGTSNHLTIHLGANVEPFSQEITGDVGKALWLLFAAVLGLLLIACINLSSLQLVRAIARDRDNALRAALGAGKSRLFQATLMESLVLAAVGGAVAGIRHFRAIAPANLPRIHQIEISWSVLVFACRISMLSAILAGTLPALRSLHTDPQRALQSASSRIGYGRNAGLARRWLVSFEIACTIVLLIVTGLEAVMNFANWPAPQPLCLLLIVPFAVAAVVLCPCALLAVFPVKPLAAETKTHLRTQIKQKQSLSLRI